MMIFRKLVWAPSLVLLVLLWTSSWVWAQANPIPDVTAETQISLSSLVQKYMNAPPGMVSKELLSEITNHPDVSLASLTKAIQGSRVFSKKPTGRQPSQQVVVRGHSYGYGLYVPPSYDPTKAYPLIVCLHGAGFTGDSYLSRWVPRLNNQYILACPTIPMGTWWRRTAEDLVLEVIENIQTKYHVDKDRVFLTGMSNGGIGTWIIGMHYADRFAGIAPMASGIDDVLFPFVENLRETSVYVIHGLHDQVMPVSLSRSLVNEMNDHRVRHIYQEHNFSHEHAGGHFFPKEELPALVSWFDGKKRDKLSKRISLVRDATHLTNFDWVRIDATDRIAAFSENLIDRGDEFITGKVYAKLDAEVTSPNLIVLKTQHVRRCTVWLNDDLVDFSQPVKVEMKGKIVFEQLLTPNLKTLLKQARLRQDSQHLFSARITLDVP